MSDEKQKYEETVIKGNYECYICKKEHWGRAYMYKNEYKSNKHICPKCYDGL